MRRKKIDGVRKVIVGRNKIVPGDTMVVGRNKIVPGYDYNTIATHQIILSKLEINKLSS